MTSPGAIVIVGLGVLGAATMVASLPVFRRPRLAARLHGYLGALAPRQSPLLTTERRRARPGATFLRPVVDGLGQRWQHLLGDEGHDLPARLDIASSELTVSGFRARQVSWALCGFGAAIAGALALAAVGRSVSGAAALVAAAAFGVGGALLCDHQLTRTVERRRQEVLVEFPIFVDLLCLAVTAGESLRGGLEIVAAAGTGPLASEMRAVLRDARTGRALGDALDTRCQRLGVAPLERFVGSVLAAQERGLPLAETLQSMAFDVRESEKRAVIEAGGKKQISMLLPVVALILPVAIVFAFYPGLVAIRTLAR